MIRLPKVIAKSKKRVGRGMGSGKGSHTVGRGQKGQKTRRKIGVLFEGVKMKKSLLKRLPLMRGKGKFHPKKTNRAKYKAFKFPTKTSK
jgi:large subunit ribosomal protein L15